jgi:scyllo-inositol 2-dehydrogenase (NADP+)
VDRQEIKTFIHEPTDQSVRPGWNARYTTDLPNDVWYYLRGEEYSAQIDYFIQCIKESCKDNISSFATAIETDLVVSMILQNALGSTNTVGLQATKKIRNRPFLGRLKDALP